MNDLAATKATALADEIVAMEESARRARESTIAAVKLAIGKSSDDARRGLLKILKKLGKGKLPDGEGTSFVESIQRLARLEEELAQAHAAFESIYAAEEERLTDSLRALALDPRFQEAVIWQNPQAFTSGVERVCRQQGSGHSFRKNEYLVANYLQRYCVKNDMIGFFGPQALGAFSEKATGWNVKHGTSFLKKRRIYFEHWAIAALADSLARDPTLRPWTTPRLLASLRLEDCTLHHPDGKTTVLPVEFSSVLRACDGTRRLSEIADGLGQEDELEEEEVFELFALLEDKGIVSITFPLPSSPLDAEAELARLVAEITGDEGIRARAQLAQLRAAREDVANAAEDPERLQQALSQLNVVFEELTGEESSRNAGEVYAGRTLVYEECCRDVEVQVGIDAANHMAAPLELILQSARWFTYEVAKRYDEPLRAAHDELARELSTQEIPYLQYWSRIKNLFGSGDVTSDITREVQAELRARWIEILAIRPGERRIQRSSASLAPNVADLFSAPGPGWPAARYHSPDIMLSRQAGSAKLNYVVGEIHASVNTCGVRNFLEQLDDSTPLIRARQLDLPRPALVPVTAREQTGRADHEWMSAHNIDLELGFTPSAQGPDNTIRVSDLIVYEEGGRLIVSDRSRAHRFEILEALENYLTADVSSEFTYLPVGTYRPRIQIDDVVIGRETWRFEPEDLGFSTIPRGPKLFLAVRRWAHDKSLPTHIFVKIPEEDKPVYIDLSSPISVEQLARLAKKASRMTVSEMLPDFEALWLSDRDGQTYTSEVRLVAVDAVAWSPAS